MAVGAITFSWLQRNLLRSALHIYSVPLYRYKDKLGQQLAGTVTRSRLFEASTIQDSTLGPPRTEPTTPTAAAVAKVPDTPPVWTPRMPDNTWWNGGHRKLLQLHRHPATTSSSSSSRHLLQSKKDQLVAVLDENFKWPYPTITGDRPPVGQDGKPARGSARQICGTRTFSFGMVFGPLLPAACGVFEVGVEDVLPMLLGSTGYRVLAAVGVLSAALISQLHRFRSTDFSSLSQI